MYWDKVSPTAAASALSVASSSGASLTETIDRREFGCLSSAVLTETPLGALSVPPRYLLTPCLTKARFSG